jgi:hypothetical protein
MRQLLTAFCFALSGVCISAFPDAAISKPSSSDEPIASTQALGSRPDKAPASGTEPDTAASKPGEDSKKEDSSKASTPDASTASKPDPSREEFCKLLMTAAEENTLPIGFFVNLIWQESRFVRTAVSSAGALGVAQFMPAVAENLGLRNPFDPRQALPASARLLRTLHEQFGNLGLAAAAYNAGPKRVLDWLAKRGQLPRETRNYVLTITGRPAEHWTVKPPPPIAFQVPRRVPCFEVEAFAAAVKPADSPPPREDAPAVKAAEAKPDTKAVKSRSAAKRTKHSARVRAAFKNSRIKAAIAKRTAPKPTKEAAKSVKKPVKSAKEALRSLPRTAQR